MATITNQEMITTPGTWDSFKKGLRESGLPWAFIAPSVLVMLFITFLPQAYQIYISFRDFQAVNLSGVTSDYINLENYNKVLFEGLNVPNYDFFPLLGFNIVWTLINVVFHAGFGLFVALALNARYVLGRRIYRVLFVIPWALPGYITALIWNNLWQKNDGGVNLLAESVNDIFGVNLATDTDWLLDLNPPVDLRGTVFNIVIVIVSMLLVVWFLRGLQRDGIRDKSTGKLRVADTAWNVIGLIVFALIALSTLFDVLGNGSEASGTVISMFDRAGAPMLAFYAVLVANIWLGWPFMMVVATGALQSIPPDLYEAADVDGASKWRQLISITLPLIRPAMVPAIMLGTIWTFNQFNVIFFITAGGPRGQTDLLVTQAYKLIQQEQLYGAAAAFSIIVFFVLLIITLINNRITHATKAFDEA